MTIYMLIYTCFGTHIVIGIIASIGSACILNVVVAVFGCLFHRRSDPSGIRFTGHG